VPHAAAAAACLPPVCRVLPRPPQIPFLFLADVRDKFAAAYGSRAKTAIAYAMPEFARTLADRMTYFNDNPAADAFGKVKDQLAEVKDVMVENIGARGAGAWGRRGRAAGLRHAPPCALRRDNHHPASPFRVAAASASAAAAAPLARRPAAQSACSRAARRLSCWWTRATS